MNDALRWRPNCSVEVLRARAELLAEIRQFFAERNVLEVQTPCLGSHTVTDPNIESIAIPDQGYLQTSPEFYLKRLLAAGAPSLYQMGPVFRAGERGALHNPEFTMLEWYRLGFDDAALMAEVAELVDMALGAGEYRTLTYEQVCTNAPARHADAELTFVAGLEALGQVRVFVVDFPPGQAALARLRGTPPTAARFELVVDSVEVANGYHELGDPAELRERFSADLAIRRERGASLPAVDEAFLAAMDAGLPDSAGVAVGIDRLLMLRLGADSLSEVLPFSHNDAAD